MNHESIINNWINGNIKDAKRQAKHIAGLTLEQSFIDAGFSPNKARLTAQCLKGWNTFQEACDAE